MFGTHDLKAIFGLRGKKKINLWGDEWESDPLREEMFNTIASEDEDFLKAQKRDISAKFQEFVKYRAQRPSNLIICIEGPQGEGKSMIAEWVVLQWKDAMLEYQQQKIEIYFTFNISESQNQLSKEKDGDMTLQDEDSRLIGRGAGTAEAELQNLVETMRYTQKSIVICAPHIKMIPGMVTLLRPMGQYQTENKNEFKSKVLVYQLREDQPSAKRFVCLGYIIADVGSIPENFHQKYLKAKNQNYRELEKSLGGAGVQKTALLKQLNLYAKKVLKIAKKHGWPRNHINPSKKDLTPYFMEGEMAKIHVSRGEEEIIKQLTVELYEKEQAKLKKPTQTQTELEESLPIQTEFTLTEQETLDRFTKESPDDRNLQIYIEGLDPLSSGKALAKKYDITTQRITQIKNDIRGRIYHEIGHSFEAFLLPKLKEIYSEVTYLGGIGQPDFICRIDGKTVIYSVKCFNFERNSYSVKFTESDPEIKFARKIEKEHPIVICFIYNIYNQKIYEYQFPDQIVKIHTPYTDRNITLRLNEFTKDPAKDPWVVIPK